MQLTPASSESAILKGVASHRPGQLRRCALLRERVLTCAVGRHKHILIISLQSQVHEQTGVWVPIARLWDTLGELYNLDALDQMVRPWLYGVRLSARSLTS